MSILAEFICPVSMELQMQCYITPFFAYERFFFVYNDISSRYYNLLSIRLGDCVYKHYTLWHIKCQWVAIGKKAATTGCFLQHYFNSIPLWQVYKQVRKKKTVQKLIVTDSDAKQLTKAPASNQNINRQTSLVVLQMLWAQPLVLALDPSSIALLLAHRISIQLLLWTT